MRTLILILAMNVAISAQTKTTKEPAHEASNYPILSAAKGSPPESVLLKARILQLEGQLEQLSGEQALCTARLSQALQPQIAQSQGSRRADIEKEAGCSIDWNVLPPVCKPSPQVKESP